ncbi:MAG: acyltransferase [Alphaproteobacteria bacterium]
MQHRPEIDGLRAFAVLPVMFFHAGFAWVGGGFIGVDIFFVISGFLITSIVQREVTEKRFTLVGFYERRARRIFPALFTIILICFPFAWWLMDATQLRAFGKSAIAASVFLANFYFAGAANYFEPSAELMPLLHTWSLSVEEQFYVFFPILLLALSFLGITHTRNIVIILGLLALGAFSLTIFMAKVNPTLNFYWPVSRAWELLAGAIAAFVYTRPSEKSKVQECVAALGFVMLIGGLLFLRAEMENRFAYSIFPVIGTVLVLVTADGRTLTGRFFDVAAFRGCWLDQLQRLSASSTHIRICALLFGERPIIVDCLRFVDCDAGWGLPVLAFGGGADQKQKGVVLPISQYAFCCVCLFYLSVQHRGIRHHEI